MHHKYYPSLILLISILAIFPHSSCIDDQLSQIALTIYTSNIAVIKDTRTLSFQQGQSTLYFTDVAASIEPPTVTFKATKDPTSVSVYQQNFDSNIVTKQGILKKYVEKDVELYVRFGDQTKIMSGRLLGFERGYFVESSQGIQQFNANNIDGIGLDGLPDGFFTVPTLSWKVWSRENQTTPCQIAYRAGNLNWVTKYTFVFNKDETKIDLASWVQIINNSGKTYRNAKLKLVAGDVNIIQKKNKFADFIMFARSDQSLTARPSFGQAPEFTQKSFSDFHLYTLSQPVTIGEGQSKQIQLMPKLYELPIQKQFRIRVNAGGIPQERLPAEKWITFNNSKQNKLGVPFPKGSIESFKQDQSDGALEYVGASSIENVPKNENITAMIGMAPAIVSKLVQVQRVSLDNSGGYSAKMQIRVTNYRQQQSTLVIKFMNYYSNNLKLTSSQIYEIISAREYEWRKTIQSGQSWQFEWQQNYTYTNANKK